MAKNHKKKAKTKHSTKKKLSKTKKSKKKPIDFKTSKDSEEIKYLKTKVKGFDKLFKRGVPHGSSVLIEGGPGSGKTLFCLNMCHTFCKQGLKVLFMSFEEPEKRLIHHMKNFGFNMDPFLDKNLFKVKRFNALDIARSVEALLSEAKKELLIEIQPVLIPQDFQPDILIIDSLSAIASAFSGEESRFRIYMEQLFRYLESNDITSFLIRESPNPTHTGGIAVDKGEAVSFLSDGIIVIYNVMYKSAKRGRAIEVLKMRGEDINRQIVEMEIVDKVGCVVRPNKPIKDYLSLT